MRAFASPARAIASRRDRRGPAPEHSPATANANRLVGDVFVQPFARFRSGPEEPLDLLNDDADPFLPLGLTSGDVLLVQKSQIAVVGTELPAVDDSVERGVVGMHVELGLID